jgi:Arc/MetJ-type ribon-helix-helix transcriptional regulator
MAGKTKTHTGFRMPPDIERKVNALIENEEFNTKSDVFVAALRFYFDHKDANLDDKIEAFLLSERGQALIKKLMKDAHPSKARK